jgi:hypothetical protein
MCGGVGNRLNTMLAMSDVSIIIRIRESAGEIIAAPMADRLHAPRFCMPRRVAGGGRRAPRRSEGALSISAKEPAQVFDITIADHKGGDTTGE